MEPSGGCEVSPHSALKGRVDARGTRSVDSRWAVSYLLAQCQVELRSRTERLSTESVWPLELPQCVESLSLGVFGKVGYAVKGQTLYEF